MYITRLEIREFGGLRDLTLELSRGFNLLSGENESGKSTILAFIRFMLYGLPKRAAGEVLSDGDRAYSWENGLAEGSLSLVSGGTHYRIERREGLNAARKRLQIIDEASGLVVHKGEVPGLLFLGIPMQVFDSTACVRQMRAGGIDGTGLSGAIENLLLSGDESVNTDKALKRLDEARKTLQHKGGKKGGRLYEIECEIKEIEGRMALAQANAEERRRILAIDEEEQKRLTVLSREIEILEGRCSHAAALRILQRFDDLHGREAELKEAEAQAERLCERQRRKELLPDRDFVSALRHAADDLDENCGALLRAQAERKASEGLPLPDKALLDLAGKIARDGGGKQIADEAALALRTAEGRRKRGILLTALGGTATLLALLLALLLHPLFLSLLCGLIPLCIGLGGILQYRRICREIGERLQEYGYTPSVDPVRAPHICIRDFAIAAEAAEQAERQLSLRREILQSHEEDCRAAQAAYHSAAKVAGDLLSRVSDEEVSPKSLRRVADAISEDIDARFRTETRLSLLMEAERAEREALAKYDEIALRAEVPEEVLAASPEEREEWREALAGRNREKEALEAERLRTVETRARLFASGEDVQVLAETLDRLRRTESDLRRRLTAILTATDALARAKLELKAAFTPRLRRDAIALLSEITGGAHASLALDTASFALSSEAGGESHPVDAFSGGTKDSMYLSLRIALSRLLSPGDPLPLLLDEALAQLDDRRASALLSLLHKDSERDGGRQILLFTCHTREATLLEKEGLGERIHRISL